MEKASQAIDQWLGRWLSTEAAPEGPRMAAWNRNFLLLQQCVAETGLLPKRRTRFRGVNLYSWCLRQRLTYRGSGMGQALTPVKIQKLETIPGWSWGESETTSRNMARWNLTLAALHRYIKQYGCLPPARVTFQGFDLHLWCQYQRLAYRGRKTPLSAEKIEALEQVPGWQWEPN